MRMKSAFLAIAAAVIGFAYITPEASAQPPAKGAPGTHSFHKKQQEAKKTNGLGAQSPSKVYRRPPADAGKKKGE